MKYAASTLKKATSILSSVALLFAVLVSPVFAAETSNTHSTDLNGTTQYWTAGDPADGSLDMNGKSFSVFVSARLDTLPSAGNAYTFTGKRNGTGNQRAYHFSIYNDSGTYKLNMQTSLDGSTFFDYYSSGITISAGEDHTFGMRFTTGTGAIKFYYDGASAGTATSALTDIKNSTAAFNIGRIEDGAFYLDGKVDLVLVYNDAIADGVFSSLDSDPCNPSTTNLVSGWRFNNDGSDFQGSNTVTAAGSAGFTTTVTYTCSAGGGGTTSGTTMIMGMGL